MKSARASGIRDHGATSTTVQTLPPPVLARTWRRPSFSRAAELCARRADELELTPGVLGQLDELDPELEHGRGQLGELRAERDPDAVALGRGLAQRERSPPGAAADEPCRERDLAHEPPARSGRPSSALDEGRRARAGA